ncbi:MAG: Ig-like domain-containing domain [Bacteroidia bacterium]|nr:Ig-like domain-containing domain [Bacteroidia bacterium]
MDKSIFARFFLLALLFILISTCARISSPSGGPRDKIPPVVTKNIPQSGTKNFRGDSFIITFNEYVVLDNINEKFMVSPPMKKKPRILIKGKNIIVEFDDKLRDSTTYTFYFQDAIKDLNEGNILENYKFVFSTGPVIDSLSVTGNVYNSFNLEVPEKTLALMYRELADSAVVEHFPDYISTVDQNGYFRIDNVRPGNYRIYALKDVDNSKNYNLTEEEFAFINSPVAITAEKNFIPVVKDTTTVRKGIRKVAEPVAKGATTVKKGVSKVTGAVVKDTTTATIKGEFQLILFTAQRKEHYLTRSSRDLKYQMIYTLSLPPDSMKFEFSIPGTGDDAYFIEKSRNKDTLKVWLTDSTLYKQPQITTIVKYPFTDTLKTLGYKEDTILMRFLTPRAPRVAKVRKSLFTVNTNILTGFLKPGQCVVFSSQTPFRPPDTSRIRLYELIDTIRQKVPFLFTKDSTNSCKYILAAKLLMGKKYLFIADSASFGNIYNEYSDSAGIKFSVRDPESYSKLTLNIQNYEGDRIIQLLDNTEKLVSEVHMKKDGKIAFPLLESGFYRVRVIYDINGDGIWTTGDFNVGRQPEPVSYYPGELEIKIGWELEQDWDIGVKDFKNQKLRVKRK